MLGGWITPVLDRRDIGLDGLQRVGGLRRVVADEAWLAARGQANDVVENKNLAVHAGPGADADGDSARPEVEGSRCVRRLGAFHFSSCRRHCHRTSAGTTALPIQEWADMMTVGYACAGLAVAS